MSERFPPGRTVAIRFTTSGSQNRRHQVNCKLPTSFLRHYQSK
jgi:hypothetical protein